MPYYAIQDRVIGFIQYVGEAPDKIDAIQQFIDHINGDQDSIAPEDFEVTELPLAAYQKLNDGDGTDQTNIEYLEAIKTGPEKP